MTLKVKAKSITYLVLCSMIWGLAFVAQRAGMDDVGPFYFSGLRMLIGAAALVPIFLVADRGLALERKRKGLPEICVEEKCLSRKYIIQGGIVCGIVIFFASNLQQIGLVYVSAGKTAFITTLYIVIVPFFGLFLKHKPTFFNWIAVLLGTIGLYFLSIKGDFSISFGDLIVLIGSVFWALHILFIDYYAPKVNVAKLVCVQFLVAGVLSLIIALFRETITMDGLMGALPSILYTGIFSTAIAFTFQALGQKNISPVVASIILSGESFFGALGGYFILGEVLSSKELVGCALLLTAVIVAQLPPLKRSYNKEGKALK